MTGNERTTLVRKRTIVTEHVVMHNPSVPGPSYGTPSTKDTTTMQLLTSDVVTAVERVLARHFQQPNARASL